MKRMIELLIIVAVLVVSLTVLGGGLAAAQTALWPAGPAIDLAQGSQPLLIGTVGIGIEPLAVSVSPTTHRVYASGQSTVRVLDGFSAVTRLVTPSWDRSALRTRATRACHRPSR